MKQVELTTKLVLAIIGLTSVSAILVPTYAVPTIKSGDIFDGEVKTADLANGAVTNPKLANDAVTSGKIKNGEVKAEDIAAGVIPSGGIQGTVQGVKGDAVSLDPGHFGRAFADCPDGTILTGGGFQASPSFRVYTTLTLSLQMEGKHGLLMQKMRTLLARPSTQLQNA